MARTKHGVELTNDGLDEDGKPLNFRDKIPYVRGSEAAIGKVKPVSLGAALDKAVGRVAAAMRIGDSAESPIEVQIGAAISEFFRRADHPLKLCLTLDPSNLADELVLVPQFSWSYYRSDWAILNPSKEGALLIECDGRDFHSSDEQKAHDRRKDLAALERGYLTLRFTGTQIFRDADKCAQQVFDAVCGGAQ